MTRFGGAAAQDAVDQFPLQLILRGAGYHVRLAGLDVAIGRGAPGEGKDLFHRRLRDRAVLEGANGIALLQDFGNGHRR